MSFFQDRVPKPGATPSDLWIEIKEYLMLGHQSVEIILDEEEHPFLRVWDEARNNGSNEFGADPDRDH